MVRMDLLITNQCMLYTYVPILFDFFSESLHHLFTNNIHDILHIYIYYYKFHIVQWIIYRGLLIVIPTVLILLSDGHHKTRLGFEENIRFGCCHLMQME